MYYLNSSSPVGLNNFEVHLTSFWFYSDMAAATDCDDEFGRRSGHGDEMVSCRVVGDPDVSTVAVRRRCVAGYCV